MSKIENIYKIFTYLGVGVTSITIAFGLIKFLSKNIFENYLLKKLETHKSELERFNISYQIQFSSLHVERAEIIKSLYNYLYEYKLIVLDFFSGQLDSSDSKKHLNHILINWTKVVVEFSDMFHKNKIFFSISQVELINKIQNEMSKINKTTQDFLNKFQKATEQINAIQTNIDEFARLKTESDKLIANIMLLENQLENEFRNLLGVEFK